MDFNALTRKTYLASGEYAHVYSAYLDDRKVAVKVLKVEWMNDARVTEDIKNGTLRPIRCVRKVTFEPKFVTARESQRVVGRGEGPMERVHARVTRTDPGLHHTTQQLRMSCGPT